MWDLFTAAAVLTMCIFSSEFLIFACSSKPCMSHFKRSFVNPLLVGWIIGICSYELLHNALHSLTHIVAVTIISVVYLLSRCMHSFIHTHEGSTVGHTVPNNIELTTSHTCNVQTNNTMMCNACESHIQCQDQICHVCEPDSRNTTFLSWSTVVQKHIAFGTHVFIDALLIGIAYHTSVFWGILLAIGTCMLQDTAALSMCLLKTNTRRPRLQACISVSCISWIGICLGAFADVPPMLSAIASSISIGLLTNEITDFELLHAHKWEGIKQTLTIGLGMGVAFAFYFISHVFLSTTNTS